MSKNYFFGCETAEELKKEFKKLAKALHPDNGGSAEAFKEMQAQFTRLFDRLKNVHVNKNGDKWEAEGERATTETAEEFMEVILKLMFIDTLEVELCGSWIWVGGDTKTHKDLLKELGFRYSSNKQKWYYQRDGKRKWHGKAWSMDEIRNAYGSKQFKGQRDKLEEVTA